MQPCSWESKGRSIGVFNNRFITFCHFVTPGCFCGVPSRQDQSQEVPEASSYRVSVSGVINQGLFQTVSLILLKMFLLSRIEHDTSHKLYTSSLAGILYYNLLFYTTLALKQLLKLGPDDLLGNRQRRIE